MKIYTYKMKTFKLFTLFISALFIAPSLFAAGQFKNAFSFNSRFVRNETAVAASVGKYLTIGAEGSFVNHDHFDDNIYTAVLPVFFKSGFVRGGIRPFYVPDADGLSAMGGSVNFVMDIKQDEINEIFTQAGFSIAYADQKAFVERAASAEKEHYKQVVYSLTLRQNYYNAFVFSLSGSLFQYPSGISNVNGIAAVLDQNYLGDLGTYDTVYSLPKYSVGASLVRMFENKTNIYLTYRFTEMYLENSVHSVTLGNEFPVFRKLWGDMGYNHTIDTSGKNRDLFKIALKLTF
ncbi:hypothetical protein Dip518_001347 [Parelusimicrobium proximum]|uniref:hypothetical protein n=1 Tax=Parelusimicrobium proximum TaxID=3228953 RepID=UPI003D17B466